LATVQKTVDSPLMRRLVAHSDIVLAVAVVAIVAMMVIPLPSGLLDVLLTLNIAMALTIILVAMYIGEPLEFSVFPSLLLVTTLFRLGLNVSSTKLILLNGFAGEVIHSFGNFVVGGNYVVGAVVFLILTIIQFVVITNGAGRVAEVAARFTLDAMPGKQMSIDADLNAGLIGEQEARKRRKAIEQEADFYGAMDGASKFVKGDAIAGIIIIVVNIIGGFTIGVVQRGQDIMQALQTYTILTIGDGLVTQVPALLIATGTGLIVTRAASDANLGEDVTRQLLTNPRALAIVAGLLMGFGLVPGLPKGPFFIIAAAMGGLALVLRRGAKAADGEAAATQAKPEGAVGELAEVADLLRIDPIELEIGYALVPLADEAERGGGLLARITSIRRQIALQLGIVVPVIRVRDNLQLPPGTYVVKVRGQEVARADVRPGRYLAMPSAATRGELQGESTLEPAFGLPAFWIPADQRDKAELLGYTVVDVATVITTHLAEAIKANASTLLTRQDVQELVNHVKTDNAAVVEELIPAVLSLGDVQRVLQNLLNERVSARDLQTVLEVLADKGRLTKDTETLTEYVRAALGRSITGQYRDGQGLLYALTLAPVLERKLEESIQPLAGMGVLALDPSLSAGLLRQVAQQMERVAETGNQPVILCSPRLRPVLRRWLENSIRNPIVLSYAEITPPVQLRSVGLVEMPAAA
jgi:flagellar biosynthesis protein FlhA